MPTRSKYLRTTLEKKRVLDIYHRRREQQLEYAVREERIQLPKEVEVYHDPTIYQESDLFQTQKEKYMERFLDRVQNGDFTIRNRER